MEMEEKLINKSLYKIELYVLKILPMLLAIIDLAHTIYSYFVDDETAIFSLIGGISVVTLIFLYVTSYIFKFCEYHRMFLHYVTVDNILATIDYSCGIPLSDRNTFIMYLLIAGVFMFLILYLKIKSRP